MDRVNGTQLKVRGDSILREINAFSLIIKFIEKNIMVNSAVKYVDTINYNIIRTHSSANGLC